VTGKLSQAPQEFHAFVLQTAHQAATYAAMERRPEDAAHLTWEAHEYAKANFAGYPLPALETLQIHLNLVIGAGEFAKAEPLMRQVVASKMMLLGEDHLDLSAPFNNAGYVLMNLGKTAEAAVEFQAALAVLEPQLGAEHPVVKMVRAGAANNQ
jgi:hypothetical protein